MRGLDLWRDAERVLDVGCGNGFFLNQLADAFPDKEYLGVDVNAGVLALAPPPLPGRPGVDRTRTGRDRAGADP